MTQTKALFATGITLALSLSLLGAPAAFADAIADAPLGATENEAEPQTAPSVPGTLADGFATGGGLVTVAETNSADSTTRAAVTNAADYFQAMGATDAHLILTNASYTKYFSSIQLGSADSATSLPNLLLALDYIDEANALRVSESLDTLLVGDSLMAAAMANADHIRVTWAHPQQWGGLAENIAAGYRGPAFSTSSPFRGWFGQEKVLWNQAVASGDYPGLADMSAYQIYATYPALYNSVGHYLNIIDPGDKTTGFGVYTGSSSYPYYAQEFAGAKGTFFSTQNGKTLAAGRLLSVADYRASVLSYAKDTAIAFDSAPTPVISGTAEVGNTLTATKAGKNDFVPAADTVSYQWLRNGQAITGATQTTYTLTPSDAQQKITVQVTGSKAFYSDASKTSAAVTVAPMPPNVPTVTRLSGKDRYGTNRAVNARFVNTGGPVFVATGADFADALSIGPVVKITGGTLILSGRTSIDQATLDQVQALSPSAVYVIGGKGAVSEGVVSRVAAATGRSPERVSGTNRYETSEAIYQKFFVDTARPVATAFVATGRDFPDALSSASAGAALSAPVLLVDGKTATGLPSYLTDSLQAKGTSKVLISGGTGAVNRAIESSLKQSFNTERLSGPNRYSTNLAIDAYVAAKAGSQALTSVWIATGEDFPDALSAAATSGELSSRLVLSNGTCIPKPVVSSWISPWTSKVTNVWLAGGTSVLKQSVANLTQCK